MKNTSILKLNNLNTFKVFKYIVLIFAFLLVGVVSGEKVEASKCDIEEVDSCDKS